MVSRPSLDFSRQRIIVAGDDSPATTLILETLRHDGHRVTHAGDAAVAVLDLAERECHLFVCGPGIDALLAIDLIHELRARVMALPVVCFTDDVHWTREMEGLLPSDVAVLHGPTSREQLRAAVRPLLTYRSSGTTLALLADGTGPRRRETAETSAVVPSRAPRTTWPRPPAG